jgi:hypothetical protein
MFHLKKSYIIKNEIFVNFWKQYVLGDKIKCCDKITGFDGTFKSSPIR